MKTIGFNNTPKKDIIKEAVKTLKSGGLVIYPTETCYGLGADAVNPRAIDKLLAYKGNRKSKPTAIAVANKKMAAKYIRFNSITENIINRLLPGPITIVCQSRRKTDPRLESKQKTLGIRMPDHPFPLAIIKKLGKPITATSANASGGKTPYSPGNILSLLSPKKKRLIGLIVDAGQLPRRPPSTVVDTTLNEPALIRQGEIDFSRLNVKVSLTNSAEETQALAQNLLQNNRPILKKKAVVFALQGELGAGKTQFAKGLGKVLNITRPITSPTFVFVKEYPYRLKEAKGVFYHIDAWRLAGGRQVLRFVKNCLAPGNIVAIEWIQKDKSILDKLSPTKKAKIIRIEIKHLTPTRRKIKIAN